MFNFREAKNKDPKGQAPQGQPEGALAQQNVSVTGVEIFKAGRHKPTSGDILNFLDRDLEEVVLGFDAKEYPVPVVVGHPQTNWPAYGWVSSLRVEGNKLVADFDDVDPQFSELVKAKRYRKISASFFRPDGDSNPTPGKWALRHVGFLGAAAPAVPGLKGAEFNAEDAGSIEFGESDIADLPAHHLATMARHHHDVVLEKIINDGKLLPIHKDNILDFVCAVDDGSSVSFADGERHSKSEWLLNFLSEQPKIVSFGAMKIDSDPIPANGARHDLPSGFVVDPDRQALADAATAMSDKEGISFTEAIQRLER